MSAIPPAMRLTASVSCSRSYHLVAATAAAWSREQMMLEARAAGRMARRKGKMVTAKRAMGVLLAPPLVLVAYPVSAATPAPAKLAALADCAGAVAVVGHVDPRGGGNDPKNPWFMTYAYILSDMVDMVEPKKAHDAAVKRWSFWSKQSAAAASRKATACRSQHPG